MERLDGLFDATAPQVVRLGPYKPQDVPDLIEPVDWVVVPSVWWENAPLVIAEAQQHNRPAIVTGVGGMFEGERQQEAGEAFSGWKTVSYGDSAHISAFASDQVITWQNVYFATRMSVSGRNAFAWAKFANFRAIANG